MRAKNTICMFVVPNITNNDNSIPNCDICTERDGVILEAMGSTKKHEKKYEDV